MKKILFVCHGNICRSPMAEYIMKDIVHKNQKEEDYFIDSVATSNEEIGNDLYYKAKEILKANNIPFTRHVARRIQMFDYETFDYIIVMDEENLYSLKHIIQKDNYPKDSYPKIYKLKQFMGSNDDIIDPWYSRNFSLSFMEIRKCCENLFLQLENNK